MRVNVIVSVLMGMLVSMFMMMEMLVVVQRRYRGCFPSPVDVFFVTVRVIVRRDAVTMRYDTAQSQNRDRGRSEDQQNGRSVEVSIFHGSRVRRGSGGLLPKFGEGIRHARSRRFAGSAKQGATS